MKIGIVGCGFIAEEFMKNISMLNNITVVAVYSRTFENSKAFCKKHIIRKCVKSFEELLSSDIDAVYIASHNDTHFKYSMEAMEKGKHVLCEKPAAISEAQLKLLENKAKEKSVFFMEAMRLLQLPCYLKLKELLESNRLGKVISIEASLGRISTRLYRHTPELIGGALFDLGIYCVYAIVDLLGVPKNIKASAIKFENGVDSTITAIFKYDNSLATFYASCVSQTRMELRVLCEKGTMTIPAPFHMSDRVMIKHIDEKVEEILCSSLSTGMIYEIEAFQDKIGDKALHKNVMKVLDKIRKQVYLGNSQDSI